jgi:DNA-binding protein H-NS
MAQYETLQAEINRRKLELQQLEQEASEVLDLERTRAVDELKTMLRTFEAFNITARDLGLASKAPSTGGPSIHKYRNPETGETCSGKGNSPAWLNKSDTRFVNPEWLSKSKPSNALKQVVSSTPATRSADVATKVISVYASTVPASAFDFDAEDVTADFAGESKVSSASDIVLQ